MLTWNSSAIVIVSASDGDDFPFIQELIVAPETHRAGRRRSLGQGMHAEQPDEVVREPHRPTITLKILKTA